MEIAEHAVGRTAENEISDPGMAIPAHHEKLPADLQSVRLKGFANFAILDVDRPAFGRIAALVQFPSYSGPKWSFRERAFHP